MTCIVGIVHKGEIFIGGDSAGSDGHSVSIRKDDKVFRKGDFVFGYTSSFRMGQLLKYTFDIPAPSYPGKDLMEYMVADFIPALRKNFSEAGYAKKDNNVESGGTFLVGTQGRLFQIEGDYQVGENHDGFDAVGSGDSFALGALYATIGQDPDVRIEKALEAAARYNAFVRPPFYRIVSGGHIVNKIEIIPTA